MLETQTSYQQDSKKPKRHQVHAACMQCKKAHAACSHTRPCDRCIRTNQPDACADGPRVKRIKEKPFSAQSSPPDMPLPDSVFMPSSYEGEVGTMSESADLSYLLLDTPAAALDLSNDFIPVFGDQQQQTPIPSPPANPLSSSYPSTPELFNNPPMFAAPPQLSHIPAPTSVSTPTFLQPTANATMTSTLSTMGNGLDITHQLLHYVKRMENTIQNLQKEVDNLRQEVATVKASKPPVTTPATPGAIKTMGPGTGYGHAVWSLPDLYLVQYNEDFATILGCQILPFQPYHFTNLFKLEDESEDHDACPGALRESMERMSMCNEEIVIACSKVTSEVGSIKKKMRRYNGELFTCAITAQILPEKNIIVTFMYEV